MNRLFLILTLLTLIAPAAVQAVPAISLNVQPIAFEGSPGFPGGGPLLVTLTLSEPAPANCSFRFTERPGSPAHLTVDYDIVPAEQNGLTIQSDLRCTINQGGQFAVLSLRCIGDWLGEPDRALLASFTDPVNCTFPSPDWGALIEDDDRAIFAAARLVTPSVLEVTLFSDTFHIISRFTREGIFGARPSLALGDVFDADGVPEVLVGSDAGGTTRLYVFRWQGAPGLGETTEYFPFGTGDTGGCYVAAGDAGGYGSADDVLTGPRNRSPLTMQIWAVRRNQGVSVNTLVLHHEFTMQFNIGGRSIVPATGDLNGDGRGDIFAADGPGSVFDCAVSAYHGSYSSTFDTTYAQGFAFHPYPGNRDGLSVSAGDWNGDGHAEVVTGAGPNSGSHVLMYDPVRREPIVGFFVTSSAQGFNGGAKVAMTPRRHYSPSGGNRTLLLAGAISVSHPGVLYSSDGAPPATLPAGLVDTLNSPIAAWTPAQQRAAAPLTLHLDRVDSFQQGAIPVRRHYFRVTGIPRFTRWRLQNSVNLQNWSDTLTSISLPGATGDDYFDTFVSGAPAHAYWRLRQE